MTYAVRCKFVLINFRLLALQIFETMSTMSSDKVKGIISLCNGDRKLSVDIFKTIDIEPNHRIFTCGELTPVATRIGLKLLALRIPSETPGLSGASLSNQVRYYCKLLINLALMFVERFRRRHM